MFYLTTPLYYVNAQPHLGHAYSTIVADALVRFQRQMGEEACFLTGTDEHGQKIERAAAAAGISPQQYADRVATGFRAEWDRLGLNYDYFIRTTEPRHTAAVLDIFARLQKNGWIYKGTYSGPYCVSDELFVGEGAPGDPCPVCGRPTELVTEENYYFKLSAFADKLLALFREQPDFIRPETRRNEVVAFVQSGLRDVSITRTSIHWGIPVPGDEKHVLYVWFDALIGYLSGIGYGSKAAGDQERWKALWPAWHLVGKEIVRFHCVYWPAFLMAAELPLPRGIVAHGWLLFDQEKMSKSLGNVVRAEPIRQVLGADALRYFLLREVSFGQDGNFSYAALIARYNSDLANGWGNLASRTLTMIARYCGGVVPERIVHFPQNPQRAEDARQQFIKHFNDWQFSRGLEAVWQLIASADRFLAEEKPWVLSEADPARLDWVLRDAYEVLRWSAVLLAPVLPESAARLWAQLGLPGGPDQNLEALRWDDIPAGQRIGKIEGLFPRLDKEKTVEELQKLEEGPASAPPSAVPVEDAKIGIEDFAKVDLRVGEVVTAERIKGADKLLKLTVDIGTEIRQIVAGIAEAYDPTTLPGRKVVIVANLAPRKLRGVESNGMIVAAAVGDKGTPALVSVPPETPNGARLR